MIIQDSKSSTLSMLFMGQEVRFSIDDHGSMCWVVQDIAKILGIVNYRDTLRSFPDDEKGVGSTDTLGGQQKMAMVNEPGLYRLIFQSRKPEAEKMKRWVFHDVLPTLRRFGSYAIPTEGRHNLQTPDTLSIDNIRQQRLPVAITDGAPIPKHTHVRKDSREEDFHFDITPNLANIWDILQASGDWLTAKDISSRSKVNHATTNRILKKLHLVKLLDVMRCNAFWYRVSESAAERDPDFYRRLKEMKGIFEKQGWLSDKKNDWNPRDFG